MSFLDSVGVSTNRARINTILPVFSENPNGYLIPAAVMISLVTLSMSAASLMNASGSKYCAVVPTEVVKSIHSLLSTAFFTWALILSMTALGVPLGAAKPLHRLYTRSTPDSFIVGTFGQRLLR